MTYLAVFIVAAGLNSALSTWARSCVNHQPIQAGVYAGVIMAFNILTYGNALNNWALGATAVLGAFVGTYVNVLFTRRKGRATVPAVEIKLSVQDHASRELMAACAATRQAADAYLQSVKEIRAVYERR